MLEGWVCREEGGQRGESCKNCNSIINKKYFKKENVFVHKDRFQNAVLYSSINTISINL